MSGRRLLFVAAAVHFVVLACAPPGAAVAQSTPQRVGVLVLPTPTGRAYHESFRAALRELGYVEGGNLILDAREPDPEFRRLPEVVDQLIAPEPDVLVVWSRAIRIVRERTTSIPIVLRSSSDPVQDGIVKSLSRPGTNITGITQFNEELPAKHIELLREILPRLERVGMLVDETQKGCVAMARTARRAARTLGVTFSPYAVDDKAAIERAFAQMRDARPQALLPCPSAMLFNHRKLLFESALRLGVPFTSFIVDSVPDGVLFAYAVNLHDVHRELAVYVDKILKGARPEDLPIERPTRFELVVNLKTARTVGYTIPASIRLRADRVIE